MTKFIWYPIYITFTTYTLWNDILEEAKLVETISRSVVPVLGLVGGVEHKGVAWGFFVVLCEGDYMHLLQLTVNVH